MVTMRVYTEHKDITYLLVAILLKYVVGLVYINIDEGWCERGVQC